MIWNVIRGFLPTTDPVEVLSVKGNNYRSIVDSVESLASSIVLLIQNKTARQEIVCQLREVVPQFDHDLFNSFGSDAMDERGFLVYGYLAAAFVNGEKPLNRLAKEITIPLVRLAERVQRKPVLDYCSYILYNWRRKDKNGSMYVRNLEPLLTFTETEEEKRYITSRVSVEALGAPLVGSTSLDTLSDQLSKMLNTLDGTLPRVVETYFRNFVSVRYEGWGWPDPQNYNGEVMTQSTLVGMIARMLGLRYQDDDIRDYKPIPHRHFLDAVPNLRNSGDKTKYNECLAKFADMADRLSSPQSESMWKRFGTTKDKLAADYGV